jgi:hypothetical protein
MAKKRYIDTAIWRDAYTANLDPSEKLLFHYCLTSPDSNICGIYQCPLRIIASDTGIDIEMLNKIFSRFEADEKIIYRDGWIAIKNFIKHQNINNSKIREGIKVELKNAPDGLFSWINMTLDDSCMTNDEESHLNSNTDSNTKARKMIHAEIRKYFADRGGYYHDGKQAKAIDSLIKRFKYSNEIFNLIHKHAQIIKTDSTAFWSNDPHTPAVILSKADRILSWKSQSGKVGREPTDQSVYLHNERLKDMAKK